MFLKLSQCIAPMLGVVVFWGCSTPQANSNGPEGKIGEAVSVKPGAKALKATSTKRPDWALRSKHAPSTLSFGPRGQLYFGYVDGFVGVVDGQSTTLHQVSKLPAKVISVSPSGDMAMLDSQPPTLVRVKDQKQILRMNHIQRVEDGRFSPNAEGFFVSVPSGQLHIWKRGAELVKLPDEKVQRFVNRQLADVSARIWQSLAGPLALNVGPVVAIAGKDGQVSYWNPKKPKELLPLFTLKAAAQTLQLTNTHVVSVDQKGQLYVAHIAQQRLEPWSLKQKGVVASAVPTMRHDVAAVLTPDHLLIKRLKDGETLHKVAVPKGAFCGMAMSHDASEVAVCLDGVIGAMTLSSKQLRWFWRKDKSLMKKVMP